MSAIGDRLKALFGGGWHVNSDNILEGMATEFATAYDAAPSVTPGTVAASMNIVAGASKEVTGLGTVTLLDGKNLVVSTTSGTNIGTGVTQKIGFWGKTPIVQPAATAQSAVASTTITSVASTSLTALDVTRINALIDRVEAMRVLQDQTRTDLIAAGVQKGSA